MRAKSSNKFVPSWDRVLVRPDEVPGETAGGLAIPESARERATTGEVIGAGAEEDWLQPGMRVMFGKFSGVAVNIAGEEFLMLRTEELLGWWEKEA